MLPRIFARRNLRGVPWVSVLILGLAWALALKLPFERLISIDLILYGSSLILEFVALVVLRVREPNLPRPFRAGSLLRHHPSRSRTYRAHHLCPLCLAR
jgi:amino acid transporter